MAGPSVDDLALVVMQTCAGTRWPTARLAIARILDELSTADVEHLMALHDETAPLRAETPRR